MLISFVLLQAGGADGFLGPLTPFLPLILIVIVFYFFLIRPQSKRQNELKAFQNSLQKGDRVIVSGIHGKVQSIGDEAIEIEIAHGVSVKVEKHAILKSAVTN